MKKLLTLLLFMPTLAHSMESVPSDLTDSQKKSVHARKYTTSTEALDAMFRLQLDLLSMDLAFMDGLSEDEYIEHVKTAYVLPHRDRKIMKLMKIDIPRARRLNNSPVQIIDEAHEELNFFQNMLMEELVRLEKISPEKARSVSPFKSSLLPTDQA